MSVARARSLASFQPVAVRHGALWESALATLRLSIVRGDLPIGAQLVEAELAARLSVSRGPIREALRQLELEGLVVSYARRGTFVVGITEQDVREIYGLRLLLETFGIELAAREHAGDVAHLRDLTLTMQEHLHAGRFQEVADTDMAFHRAILTLADHKRLLSAWTTVAVSVQALLYVANTTYTRMPQAVEQHAALVDTIERRDSQGAASLLREHLLVGEDIVLKVLHAHEDDIAVSNADHVQVRGQ